MTRPRGRRRTLACTALLALALGAGCVAPPSGAPTSEAERERLAAGRDAAAAAFDTFRVRGGLGVWNDERSVSARIDWRQREGALDVALVAPLGLGAARLSSADGEARLSRGDAPPVIAGTADEALERALGLAVPIEQLRAWLRGLPGEASDVRRDASGRLESLRWRDADGGSWQARVLDWTTFEGLELPSLVTARGAGYRLRLVLRDWSREVGSMASDPVPADAIGDGPLAPGGGPPPDVGTGDGTPPKRLPIPARRARS